MCIRDRKMTLSDVKPLQCQKIFYDMADQGYRTSTSYQAIIALYNMFEYAKAVSYTHLDVYKRQDQWLSNLPGTKE